jgi:hypothetical protein
MFGTLIGKKRMTEQTLAKVLVSGSLRICDAVYPEIAEYMEECPHFETEPDLPQGADIDFIITVFTCNITRVPQALGHGQDKRVAQHIIQQMARSLDMDLGDLTKRIQSAKSLMKRLNHPSKNLIYAMPKALFSMYGLNDHQQAYFRGLNSPNPLYLKEMNQMLDHLVWNWDFIKGEVKITQ